MSSSVQTTIPFPIRKKTSLRLKLRDQKVVERIIISDSDDESSCASPKKSSPKRSYDASTSHSSPSKIRRCKENVSDVAASPKTPSTLISKLTIKSPQRLTPKSLFGGCDKFQSARRALHSTPATELPCRENELERLRTFLLNHLEKRTSGSLYISGQPGTGKTACLIKTLQTADIKLQFQEVYINCTTISSARAAYSTVAKELGLKLTGKSEKDSLTAIENYLVSKHKMILLVLDEIDQLSSKNQTVLYTIFEWPAIKNSKIVLVGIANALDLTDRVLPRLQALCDFQPELMHFSPYTKQQIIQILTKRLTEAKALDAFSAPALQMLAAKVASVSGDIRVALELGRRVTEVSEQSNKILQSTENILDDKPQSVQIKHVLTVLDKVYGTVQNLKEELDESFPLQQKILLCSLLLLLKTGRGKEVTVLRLYDVYRNVCEKRNLSVVGQSEFIGLCSLVETMGIIKVQRKKEPTLNMVRLMWDKEGVEDALKDKQLLGSILQDNSCLRK